MEASGAEVDACGAFSVEKGETGRRHGWNFYRAFHVPTLRLSGCRDLLLNVNKARG